MRRPRLLLVIGAAAFVSAQLTYQPLDAAGPEQAAKASAPRTFEVASVKRNDSGIEHSTYFPSRSTLVATNQELRSLIGYAYGIDKTNARFKLRGGPQRVLSTRYDVQAKLPANASPLEIPEMLRNLLSERFKLRVHNETRQQHIFALSVLHKDRLGPKLQRSSLDCDVLYETGGRADDASTPPSAKATCFKSYTFSPGAFGLHYAGTLDRFTQFIQAFVDRPIINATGLSGVFEWQLAFAMVDSSTEAPSIFTAIQEQLGLKLESRDGPVDVFVIDSAEAPTAD